MGLLNAPGGGEVKYINADKVETLDNGEIVLVYTNTAATGSFEFPGITKARILAVGGGGGGGGDYAHNTSGGKAPFGGGAGGGGQGGNGRSPAAPTETTPGGAAKPGEPGTGGGGGAGNNNAAAAAPGGSGIVAIRIVGALNGPLDKPTDVAYECNGEGHQVVPPAPFYTIDGQNVATNVGFYSVTVTPVEGVKWTDGTADPVQATMMIYAAHSVTGTVDVTGAPVSFVGAAETNWVENADGGKDLLIKFTDVGSYTLPGSSQARILAVGGGGGGGRHKGAQFGFNSLYGGGGGAGGIILLLLKKLLSYVQAERGKMFKSILLAIVLFCSWPASDFNPDVAQIGPKIEEDR